MDEHINPFPSDPGDSDQPLNEEFIMSNVYCIFEAKKKRAKTSAEYNFAEIEKKNAENKRRLVKERSEDNEQIALDL